MGGNQRWSLLSTVTNPGI